MNTELKYIIYCRKSSEEENRQAQSLETQRTTLLKYAHENNLNYIAIYEESKSAMNEDHRIKFDEMLKRIVSGEANAILVQHLDRLSRNRIEVGELIKIFQKGQLKEIRTPYKANNSIYDLFSMDYEFISAVHYSARLSMRVKEGIETKLKKGEFPGPPKLGYITVNKKQVPDPDKAHFIKKIFDLYINGKPSFELISELLYLDGFRTISGQKAYPSAIARIIQEPFYIGKFKYRDEIYQGIHKPLISEEQFQLANDIRTGKNIPRPHPNKLDFLYRGFLRCTNCGCALTATVKKSIYTYYYCTNGKHICNQHIAYLREDKLTPKVVNKFSHFFVDSYLANKSLEIYKEQKIKEYQDKEGTKNAVEDQIRAIDVKLDKLLDMYLERKIDEETYNLKQNKLKEEQNSFRSKIVDLDIPPERKLELLESLKQQCFSLGEVFEKGDFEVRKDLLKSVLWNFSMEDGEISSVQYKAPFKYLAEVSKSASISNWLAVLYAI